ncbi:sulfatase [uncultured Nocardioides sp.]|uniref:sulfatase family protein n=1 Tax=uncultured Nocardioides sp. TaxID=198441 RepID=UPI00260DA10E|nr:sulfatase [uncultured Nocardioides sp.]HRD60845.1 sulfatase [Nocardioides sp.]
MPRPRLVASALAACAAIALAGLGVQVSGTADVAGAAGASLGAPPATGGDQQVSSPEPEAEPPSPPPNVIVILTDDLDSSLVPYLPNVTGLIRDQGAELTNFYVEQSSCCPSRASILSGLYAHNHGVIGNVWPAGGYDRWKETEQDNDLPVWLERAGYRNALLGKYFNEYPYHPGSQLSEAEKTERREYVPPGWQSWASPAQGNAYAQTHYKLNVDGQLDTDFHEDYLDRWLGDRALSLVDGADGFDFAAGGQFLYYASYSPHTPYAYPPEYEDQFTDATYPRTPDFNEADVSDKFGQTRTRARLSTTDKAVIDETFRERIRSLQVLDQTVGQLVHELAAEGALDHTYLIFTSDNGYHMGNHRREIGKYTQFQNDVSVPFYVRGPGIAPGSTYDTLAGNIDIAPTIADIAGASAPADVDGLSLLPLLHGEAPPTRRYFLLGRALTPTNTTTEGGLEEAPETYVESRRSSRLNDFTGVTNGRYKLIRYTHLPHEELYDLHNDPFELDNLLANDEASYQAMTPAGRRAVDTLRAALDRLVDCSGVSCQ